MSRRVATGLALVAAGLGLWLSGQGLWIHAKALLAQQLLEGAWAQTLEGGAQVRPWPWADTWPVARLRAPRQGVDLIVLAGDSGRTLAFGPGHTTGSAEPGAPGTAIISGHRDTHFRFLEQLHPGDPLELESPAASGHFRVVASRVIDARRYRVADRGEGRRLVLVTCYPFAAITPGGPLRYVVEAEPAVL